jgi:hypothetical protein
VSKPKHRHAGPIVDGDPWPIRVLQVMDNFDGAAIRNVGHGCLELHAHPRVGSSKPSSPPASARTPQSERRAQTSWRWRHRNCSHASLRGQNRSRVHPPPVRGTWGPARPQRGLPWKAAAGTPAPTPRSKLGGGHQGSPKLEASARNGPSHRPRASALALSGLNRASGVKFDLILSSFRKRAS